MASAIWNVYGLRGLSASRARRIERSHPGTRSQERRMVVWVRTISPVCQEIGNMEPPTLQDAPFLASCTASAQERQTDPDVEDRADQEPVQQRGTQDQRAGRIEDDQA